MLNQWNGLQLKFIVRFGIIMKTISPSVYRLDSKEKVLALLETFEHKHYMTDGTFSVPLSQCDEERHRWLEHSLLGFEDWGELHRCEQALKCLNCWDCISELSIATNLRFPLLNNEPHSLKIVWKTK